jgi:hypothetical protein
MNDGALLKASTKALVYAPESAARQGSPRRLCPRQSIGSIEGCAMASRSRARCDMDGADIAQPAEAPLAQSLPDCIFFAPLHLCDLRLFAVAARGGPSATILKAGVARACSTSRWSVSCTCAEIAHHHATSPPRGGGALVVGLWRGRGTAASSRFYCWGDEITRFCRG